jgi:hypothetical protein
MSEVTRILSAIEQGQPHAAEQLQLIEGQALASRHPDGFPDTSFKPPP